MPSSLQYNYSTLRYEYRDIPENMPRCGLRECTAPDCQVSEDDFDSDGYGPDGYNRDGYDRSGYDEDGYNEDGYDRYGRDSDDRDTDGYDRYGYDASGYDRSGYNEDGYDAYGNYRWSDDSDNSDSLHDYSYKPTPVFRGESGPYFGMEIEITTDYVNDAVSIASSHAGDLVYCKADSSVDGFEAVTHPMSYEWAMAKFPWDMLPALRSEAACTVIPQENGIHIHIGRDAFKDSAHLYRWLKLWYRNPNDIQRIARRVASHWGAFNPTHRAAHKDHVKYGKPGYDRYNDGTMDRYSAINTTNADTLEIRVFASSLRPQRVKAALQLAAASVEYTRHLSCDQITHKHGWDWKAFMAWVRKSAKYPDLEAEDRIRR